MQDALMKSRIPLSRIPIPDGLAQTRVLVQEGNIFTLGRPVRPTATPQDYSVKALQDAGIPVEQHHMHAPFGANLTDVDFDAISSRLNDETLVNPQ